MTRESGFRRTQPAVCAQSLPKHYEMNMDQSCGYVTVKSHFDILGSSAFGVSDTVKNWKASHHWIRRYEVRLVSLQDTPCALQISVTNSEARGKLERIIQNTRRLYTNLKTPKYEHSQVQLYALSIATSLFLLSRVEDCSIFARVSISCP